MATISQPFDLNAEYQQFLGLRTERQVKITDWFRLRNAYKGIFTWPDSFAPFKNKLRVGLIKRMALTHAAFLMGRGFGFQCYPLDVTPDARKKAQVVEKAVEAMLKACAAQNHFNRGAILDSLLGTSGFKVFWDEAIQQVRVTHIQPEYFITVPRGDNYDDAAKVYYAYAIDQDEAIRQYGPNEYKTEREVAANLRGEPIDKTLTSKESGKRRVPVLEIWSDDQYALIVGGEPIKGSPGPNPYGFIPFVQVSGIDSGDTADGESDVDQVLEVNEALNVFLSERAYILLRAMNPTFIWKGAPADYASIVARTVGGGGVIPIGYRSDLYFLDYKGQPPDITEMMDRLRGVSIEMAGLNELAFSGQAGGSINTGESLRVNFVNVVSTLGLKQTSWATAMARVLGMMVAVAVKKAPSDMSLAIIPDPSAKTASAPGLKVTVADLVGHTKFDIEWPGLMPKDDIAAARLEIEKVSSGVQSRVTTIEKMGEPHPDDELERIAQEMSDERLNPRDMANKTRSDAQANQANSQALAATAGVGDQAGQDQTELPPAEDLAGVTGTPEGFGTDSSGAVVDQGGRQLDQTGAALAQFQAANGRGRRPVPSFDQQGGNG